MTGYYNLLKYNEKNLKATTGLHSKLIYKGQKNHQNLLNNININNDNETNEINFKVIIHMTRHIYVEVILTVLVLISIYFLRRIRHILITKQNS